MSEASTATSRLIGAMFVERGLVTAEQLQSALEIQEQSGERLGEVLVAHFGVSRLELASVLAEQWEEVESGGAPGEPVVPQPVPGAPAEQAPPTSPADQGDRRPIGEIFVEQGFVTAEELERALAAQRETGQRVGEALVAQGSITRLELASALADQWADLQKLRPPAPPPDSTITPASNGPPATAAAPPPAPATVTPEATEVRTELEAVRSELETLASRPAGDPDLTTRVDELAAKVQAIGDLDALRSTLATRVEELELRVHSIGALDGDLQVLRTSIDELRNRSTPDAEARAQLDALVARIDALGGPSSAGVDEELEERLSGLEHRVGDAAASTDVREAFDAVRDEMREVAARVEDVPDVAEVQRRLDAMEARLSDGTEQHKVRSALADLQAEVAALGGRDERGRLDSLVERLDEVEGRLPSQHVLDTLRDDVARMATRPEIDPARIEELTSRVRELSAAPVPGVEETLVPRLDQLEQRLEDLAAAPADDSADPRLEQLERRLSAASEDVQRAFEEVRTELHDATYRLEHLPAPTDYSGEIESLRAALDAVAATPASQADEATHTRLEALERRLESAAVDVGSGFDQVRHELQELAVRLADAQPQQDVVGDVEALRAWVAQLAERPPGDPSLGRRIEELAARVEQARALGGQLDALRTTVDEIAAAPPVVDDALLRRLDQAEQGLAVTARADDVRSEIGAVRAAIGEAVARLPLPDVSALEHRLSALEERAADNPELQVVREDLTGLRSQLSALAGRDEGPRFAALDARLDGIEERLVDTDALGRLGLELDAVRGELAGRPAGVSPHEVQALAARLQELEQRVTDTSGLDGVREELRGELGMVREELARRPDGVSPHEVQALAARLQELEQRVTDTSGLDGVREELRGELGMVREELARRPDGVSPHEVQALAARLQELEQRVTDTSGLDGVREELRGELGMVREELARRPDGVSPHEVQALAARLHELEQRVTDTSGLDGLREELRAELDSLIARPAVDPSLPGRLDELDRRLARLADETVSSEQLEGLHASLAELADRPAGDPALAARIDDVERTLADASRLGAVVERLGAELATLRHDAAEAAAAAARDATELENALLERLESAVNATRATADASDLELGVRVDEVSWRLGRLDGLTEKVHELEERGAAARDDLAGLAGSLETHRQALADAVSEVAGATRAEQERLDGALADAASNAARLHQELRESDRRLGERLETLAAAPVVDPVARNEAAELRKLLTGLGASLERVAAERAHDLEQSESRDGELRADLGELEDRLTRERASGERGLREELASVAARLEESDAAGVVARDEIRVELERAAASIGWRLERVEETLAGDDRDALRALVAEFGKRLDAQESRQQAQVKTTEVALRKGLAALGERLVDSETAYLEAGNTLRRSIERLGSALVEADVAAVERASDETLALHHANATSYVAFAPTAEGYRLLAVEAAVPEVGSHVELPQCDGTLVVSRIGASPIPLDTRPCAYLERA